jgi:hypothetical protein
MSGFSDRAMTLLPRIETDRFDPRVAEELQALRALWRSLSPTERAEAAPAASALAAAQAPRPPQPSLFSEDAAARRVGPPRPARCGGRGP